MPDQTRPEFNLDVDSPEKVGRVLRKTAQAFYDSASELEGDWQDKSAGRPWEIIAKVLDKAADQIDSKLKKIGF